MNNPYIGHDSQIYGVEEHRLVGGKGDGMRLFLVKNGNGLEFTVSIDRCADISRLSFRGYNFGYFSPAGYVAPSYYDDKGTGFLKSFSAGFLTTCGLTAAGSPVNDQGEDLPLHGTISNCPADYAYYTIEDECIVVRARISDARIFADKLVLHREIKTSLNRNKLIIRDTVENIGDRVSPLMLLYHFNMGFPLLDENSVLRIPSNSVIPRNDFAAKDLDTWDKMRTPQVGIDEQCYFHQFDHKGLAAIYSPIIDKGLIMSFDSNNLNYFTQWKMTGVKDYVLGLEPGNCHPNGRNAMRQEGKLEFIKPGEKKPFEVVLEMAENLNDWKQKAE